MQVKNNQVFVNGQKQEKIPGLQFNYFVQTDGTQLNPDLLAKLGINKDDIKMYNPGEFIQEFATIGLDSKMPIYHFPLNEEAYSKLQKTTGVVKIKIETSDRPGEVYPLGGGKNWTRDNYGPVWVPKKGNILVLNSYNLPIYARVISNYENNKLEVKNNVIYINDKPAKTYQFKMDYYWMMGDNRHNSADSRYWGFVPEDHVVGRPVMVWLSLEKDKGWFDGKIRWNRFFKNAER